MLLFRALRNLWGERGAPDEAEALRLAAELRGQSRQAQAIELLTALLDSRPGSLEGLILRGAAQRELGRIPEALADLARAERLAPDDVRCLQELAFVHFMRGDRERALDYCRRVRRISPEHADCCALEAQAVLGDEYYISVLERIHHHLRPRTYVEIGVFEGDTLRLAKPPAVVLGIDPEPRLVAPPGNARVFAETSDAFFAMRDLSAELGGLPVDLAFIDGMHQFEFALRDFANLERYCGRRSTILLHDCYPLDRETAERERRGTFWSGDVWRLIVLLKKYRPDLSLHTISTPPTGLAVVRRLDPASRFLPDHYAQLRDEFMALDYSYLDQDKAGKLSLFPNEWTKIRELLDA